MEHPAINYSRPGYDGLDARYGETERDVQLTPLPATTSLAWATADTAAWHRANTASPPRDGRLRPTTRAASGRQK